MLGIGWSFRHQLFKVLIQGGKVITVFFIVIVYEKSQVMIRFLRIFWRVVWFQQSYNWFSDGQGIDAEWRGLEFADGSLVPFWGCNFESLKVWACFRRVERE